MTDPEPHEYDPSRMFDAYVETYGRPAEAASTTHGIGNVAFAALAITLGCPAQAVDELHHRMLGRALPASPLKAVLGFTEQIDALNRDLAARRALEGDSQA